MMNESGKGTRMFQGKGSGRDRGSGRRRGSVSGQDQGLGLDQGSGRGQGTGQGLGQGSGRGQGTGQGTGRGRNKGGAYGTGGYCICVKCGERIPHWTGVKCAKLKCPECGHTMIREEMVKNKK